MDIATSVGTSLADRAANAVVDGTWQQFRYVLDYNDNMTKLRDNLRDLKHSKARVDHLADEARRRLEEIEDDVLSWFSRTNEAILRVDSMANETFFAGRLPNFKNRYKLSKRAKLEAPALAELTEKGYKFVRVGYSVPLHRQVLLPSLDYEVFESRESTLNSIMAAFRNRNADFIGVCGLGGVGKTTLAKEIGQRMKKEGVFKLVVMAEVHPKADVKTIQERVAEWVDIKKDVKSLDSVELRKAMLRRRLLLEERVLVILDDVWDAIDLEEVGIPIGTQCKVLVTTRDKTVVSKMAGQKQVLFHLGILMYSEARKLFLKKAGAIPEDYHEIADRIIMKCGGLPILVLPVATALKGKPLHGWDDAMQRLESGLQENEDNMQAKVYSAFQLSFSHLNADQKSLFMFCGLLKPYYINIEDLVKYTRGLNLFQDCLTITSTRNRVRTLLDDLKNYCLLLQDENREHFKMHDLVHSFARMSHGNNLFPPASYLEEWPDTQALVHLTYISLVASHIPSRLTCPKLKVLLLYIGHHEQLPSTSNDKFYVAAEELEVLYLSDMTCPSFKDLGKLQTLYADRCVVEDAADIGKLGHLKILSLKDAKIAHLPGEIERLTGLQLLDLSRCRELKEISPGVLSSFTQLEELLMADSFMQWGIKSPDGLQINADLDELKHLKMLTVLEIGVVDVKILPDNLFSDKLERFFIVVGDCWDWSRKKDVSRTLKLKLGANIRELNKVAVLLNKTDDLHLDNSAGVDLSEFNFKGLGQLKHLQLQNFHEIQYLIYSVEGDPCSVFPRLESLVIHNARQLEKICIGKMEEESFSNLKQIKIANCGELKNVFPLSHPKCLSKLEDIDVTYCEKMEGIFAMDESTNMDDQVVHLICIRKLTLEHLPCLDNILSYKLYGPSVIRTTNKDASASSSQDLAFFDEKIEFEYVRNLRLSSMKIHKIWSSGGSYSSIATLEIEGCKNIKNIFTVSMVISLSMLKILDIRDCELLTEIVIPENHGGVNEIEFPAIEYLRLEKLHSLVTVCTVDLITCPKLKDLRIDDCPELKTFCTSSLSSHQPCKSLFDDKVRFPELAVLSMSNMDKLIEVWHDKLCEDSFRKLKFLWVEKAKNLSKLFSTSMIRRVHTLEELGLLNCGVLENIFDFRFLGAGKFARIARLTRITAIDLQYLQHIWVGNPRRIISFVNLRQVVVSGCWGLASLIPTSIARQLRSLEEIKLMDSFVEQIISNEDECKDVVTFEFPKLKQMELRDDRRLISFYPGKHHIALPKLQNMNIVGCPLLTEAYINSKFGNASQITKQGQQDHPSSSSQPLFSIEERLAKEKVAPIEEERNGSPHRREDDDDVVDSDEMKKKKKKMKMKM